MEGVGRWLVATVLAVAVGAGLWFGTGPGEPPPPSFAPVFEPPETTPAVITVHVAGWVTEPGLVVVPAEARVAEAVAAAGGALPGARLDAINLAQTLADGERLVVPGPDAAVDVAPAAIADGTVHLNSATTEELETLPGVGPVLARRIVDHREQHGPFRTVEDLLDVSGIGEAKLASLRDAVVVP